MGNFFTIVEKILAKLLKKSTSGAHILFNRSRLNVQN